MEAVPETEGEVVRSERLELPLLTLDQLDHVAEGEVAEVAEALDAAISPEWLEEVRWLAGMRARQVRERPVDAPWLLRVIVRNEHGQPRAAIGHLNFHAAPDASGQVEIGYTLLPEARGQGYGIEAVRAMFDWARQAHGVHRFRASVAPDNERSLNLIGKLGFVHTGEQWDPDDELELVYELEDAPA
jgi:ribosomal-protein-alanine N-acetyltransferase